MPLRVNLLAEQHALEDMRRRDPVKRALWIGACLAALVLVYSSSLFAKSMLGKSELKGLQSSLNLRTNEYRQILDNKRKLEDYNVRLQALNRLSTNRFLMGNLMNALQETSRSEIQLLHVKVDHSYTYAEEQKAVKEDNIQEGRPASATEKILVTIDARDSSPKASPGITAYQQALTEHPYFKKTFGKPVDISLKQMGTPLPDGDGRMVVNFTLECRFPELKR